MLSMGRIAIYELYELRYHLEFHVFIDTPYIIILFKIIARYDLVGTDECCQWVGSQL